MPNPPILITYACHHAIPAQVGSARDVKGEIEKAANGAVCPRCRASSERRQNPRTPAVKCSEPDCPNTADVRGFCSAHYNKHRRKGTLALLYKFDDEKK